MPIMSYRIQFQITHLIMVGNPFQNPPYLRHLKKDNISRKAISLRSTYISQVFLLEKQNKNQPFLEWCKQVGEVHDRVSEEWRLNNNWSFLKSLFGYKTLIFSLLKIMDVIIFSKEHLNGFTGVNLFPVLKKVLQLSYCSSAFISCRNWITETLFLYWITAASVPFIVWSKCDDW